MSKSKARRDKYKGTGNTVFHMSAEEATLAKMPYVKYTRLKSCASGC